MIIKPRVLTGHVSNAAQPDNLTHLSYFSSPIFQHSSDTRLWGQRKESRTARYQQGDVSAEAAQRHEFRGTGSTASPEIQSRPWASENRVTSEQNEASTASGILKDISF